MQKYIFFIKMQFFFCYVVKSSYLCKRIQEREFDQNNQLREYSSVGSEHLPYKQRVIGSNPITPTHVPTIPKELLAFLLSKAPP